MVTAQSKPLNLSEKIPISIGPDQKLYIQCQQWGSEQKFLNIYVHVYKSKSSAPIPRYLPNILVPQVAYKFVAAMDEVIRQLPVEEPKHKEDDESPLFTQTVVGVPHYDGRQYNFELSAWHQKGGEWYFDIRSVPTSEEHEGHLLYFPFSVLPELRKKMVNILAEHDGSEQIDKMPKIPEWATPAAAKIDQPKQQPNVAQEQMIEKKLDDADEDCPYSCSGCTKEEKCLRCMPPSSKVTKRQPFRQPR